MPNRLCPIPGCKTQVARPQIMCSGHWQLLDRAMQKPIYAATKLVYDKTTKKSRNTFQPTEEYAAAVEAAIERVTALVAAGARKLPSKAPGSSEMMGWKGELERQMEKGE